VRSVHARSRRNTPATPHPAGVRYAWKKPFKRVLQTLLHHAEHEPHQLFERHLTVPGEILLPFLGTALICRFSQHIENLFKTVFFPF
jgi:hypothetical protein